jgi:hypothetical protein
MRQVDLWTCCMVCMGDFPCSMSSNRCVTQLLLCVTWSSASPQAAVWWMSRGMDEHGVPWRMLRQQGLWQPPPGGEYHAAYQWYVQRTSIPLYVVRCLLLFLIPLCAACPAIAAVAVRACWCMRFLVLNFYHQICFYLTRFAATATHVIHMILARPRTWFWHVHPDDI